MKSTQCLMKLKVTQRDIENILEDPDTEYIWEDPIPDNKEESHRILIPEATVHVENESLNVEEPPSKNSKRKLLHWSGNEHQNLSNLKSAH